MMERKLFSLFAVLAIVGGSLLAAVATEQPGVAQAAPCAGTISIVGNGIRWSGSGGGSATHASMSLPEDAAIGETGNQYVSDWPSDDTRVSHGDEGSILSLDWIHQFGTSSDDEAMSVALDSSGNVYVAGWTHAALPGQTSSGSFDAFLRKYDATGSVVWTRQFGSSASDYAFFVAPDSSGDVYLAGYTQEALAGQTSCGADDAFLVKYDSTGSILWTRQFGSSSDDYASSIGFDSSGNVYVVGETLGTLPGQSSSGSHDAFLMKYDATGSVIWTRQFGTNSEDVAHSLALDSSDNVYAAGYTEGAFIGETSSGGRDAFLRKYNPTGMELWTCQFGSTGDDVAYSVAVDSSGSSYVAGFVGGALPGQTSSGACDAFVLKCGSSGTILWAHQFGSSSDDQARSVSVGSSGNTYIVGYTDGVLPGQVSSGGVDVFLRQCDSTGGVSSTLQFGSSGEDWGYSVATSSVGNVYTAGRTDGVLPGQSSSGGYDAFLGRTGFVSTVGGTSLPTDRLKLILPWLMVGTAVAVGTTLLLVWRRKGGSERSSN